MTVADFLYRLDNCDRNGVHIHLNLVSNGRINPGLDEKYCDIIFENKDDMMKNASSDVLNRVIYGISCKDNCYRLTV